MTCQALTVEVTSSQPPEPDYDSFAWQVLSTLATTASAAAASGRFSVTLTMQPDPSGVGF